MAKPKYYLKPFWMVVKQYPKQYNKEYKDFYGISKDMWDCMVKENKTPRKNDSVTCIIDYRAQGYYLKENFLTKRFEMEKKKEILNAKM